MRAVPEPSVSSACPEHELEQAFDVQVIEFGLRVRVGEKFPGFDDCCAVWLLEGDPKGYAFPRLFDHGVEIANPKGGREKSLIQGRDDGWFSEVHDWR